MNEKSIETANGYQIKLNTGNLFKNVSTNEKAPNYTGTVNIDGNEWRLALWKNEKGYLSCKFSQDNHVGGMPYPEKKESINNFPKNSNEEFNDDIPF